MEGNQSSYKNLQVWDRSDKLAHRIYRLTKTFPAEEKYGLVNQLKRAALSVPTNLVEGWSRKGTKEFLQFVNMAAGPCAETEYLLNFSMKEGFISKEAAAPILQECTEILKMLWALIRSLREKL